MNTTRAQARPARVDSARLAEIDHAVMSGRPILLCDDYTDPSRGDIVLAAERASTDAIAFLVRHTSGFVQVALPDAVCDRLLLPPSLGSGRVGAQQCVTVDARGGGTGISGFDRARTARLLADPSAHADWFTRPGHVVPVRVPPAATSTPPRRDVPTSALWTVQRVELGAAVFATVVGRAAHTEIESGDDLLSFAASYEMPVIAMTDITAPESWTYR